MVQQNSTSKARKLDNRPSVPSVEIRVGTMKRLATFLANQENSEKLSYIAVTLKS